MGDTSLATPLFAAIMLGLYRRERTGLGSKVSTSLMTAKGIRANSFDIQARLSNAQFAVRKPGDRPINPLIAGTPAATGRR